MFFISPTNTDVPKYTDNYNKVSIFYYSMILWDSTLHLRPRKSDKDSI